MMKIHPSQVPKNAKRMSLNIGRSDSGRDTYNPSTTEIGAAAT